MLSWLHSIPSNYPDWMLFACLVKGKLVRKPFVTHVIEGVLIAFVGALAGGYLAVAVSDARQVEKVSAIERRVDDHINHEDQRDTKIFEAINEIKTCLITRCNK